jgi:hypothetical protein
VPSVAQIGVPNLLETACQVEARGELVSKRLVVDKTIRMRRANRLLVEMLSSQFAAFYSRDFCAYQRGTVFEVFRTILCPDLESLVVLNKGIQVLPAILGSSRVPRCRSGKRTVKVIFRFLKKTG